MDNNNLESKENLGHGIKGETNDTADLKSDKNQKHYKTTNEMSNMDELL